MANFDESFDEVIGLEGGYVNDPTDRGGETNWGIAKRWHPDVDIKNLTKEGAKQIYWRDYWNPLQLALVQDNDIATEVFEQAINMGKPWAARHTQESVRLVDASSSIEVDGWMGPKTAEALNRLGQRRKIIWLKCANGFQFMRYYEIVKNDPSQKRFFVGWLRRIEYGTRGGDTSA